LNLPANSLKKLDDTFDMQCMIGNPIYASFDAASDFNRRFAAMPVVQRSSFLTSQNPASALIGIARNIELIKDSTTSSAFSQPAMRNVTFKNAVEATHVSTSFSAFRSP
jgi:hypothetical protein